MRFRKEIAAQPLLDAVSRCAGEVIFTTPEGDRLNLKSKLCQYVFSLILQNREVMAAAEIVCSNPEDYCLLGDYLEKGDEP